jgi:hypothetical protein
MEYIYKCIGYIYQTDEPETEKREKPIRKYVSTGELQKTKLDRKSAELTTLMRIYLAPLFKVPLMRGVPESQHRNQHKHSSSSHPAAGDRLSQHDSTEFRPPCVPTTSQATTRPQG